MALTNALAEHAGRQPSAPEIVLALDVSFDNSYATGGLAFDPVALLKSLGNYDKDPIVLGVMAAPKNGYSVYYDDAAKKLMAFDGGTEVVAATDLSVLLANVRVLIFAR